MPIGNGWISVLIAVAFQTAGVIWWASNLTAQVAQIVQLNQSQQKTIELLVDTARSANDRLSKVQIIQEELRKTYEPFLLELQHRRGNH